MNISGTVLESIAALLDYPDFRIRERAIEACRAAAGCSPGPAAALEGFRGFVDRSPLREIEEAYTRAFDFEPAVCLEAGYHLFGDTRRRGTFLAGLKDAYRRAGFEAGRELPDHLPTLLRFLAGPALSEEKEELADQCVIPAAAAIRRRLEEKQHPYAPVLAAVVEILEEKGPNTGRAGGP